jgi:hypothetical protein
VFTIGDDSPVNYTGYTFDGGGHILSGYSTTSGNNSTNVLISYSSGVTIKNLIVEKPTNLPTTTKLNGLSIHQSTGVKLTNVTARNFKQAGVVINGSEVKATKLHTSGNAWGGVNVDKTGAIFDFSDGTSTFAETTKVWVDHFTGFDPNASVLRPTNWRYVENTVKQQTFYYPIDEFSETTDPGIVIGGIIWATRNLGEPGKFAATPFDAGYIYQWNKNIPWKIDKPCNLSNYSNSSPAGAFSVLAGYSGSWDSWTDGGATEWQNTDELCPSGWRLPTLEECEILYDRHHAGVSTDAGLRVNYPDLITNKDNIQLELPPYALQFLSQITNTTTNVNTNAFGWSYGDVDIWHKALLFGGFNGDDKLIAPVAGFIRDTGQIDGYSLDGTSDKGNGSRISGFWSSNNITESFSFGNNGLYNKADSWGWYPGDGLYIRLVKIQ